MAGTQPMSEMPRPVGRPPRISRQMIAEAAHEVGLEDLTLRAVAERLDVSIAALYHHVSGKEDLMRLAAEYAAAAVPIPKDTGQHWAVWLQEWAAYNHDIFLARPALLAQYLDGAISMESIATNVDRILGLLVRQGFTVTDANGSYEKVTAVALGSAVITTRERAAVKSGASLRAAHAAVVASHPDEDFLYLEALLEEIPRVGRQTLRDRVNTVLRGIAAEHGIDWPHVESHLAGR